MPSETPWHHQTYEIQSTNELGYNEQNEHIWLVQVISLVYFHGYDEQNPVIMNKT